MDAYQRVTDEQREPMDDVRVFVTRKTEESVGKASLPSIEAAIRDLAKRIAQVAAIERDLEMNPVPAPSWLRQGAPMDSLIYVDGQERVVTGHRWSETGYFVLTDEGEVPYLDAKSQTGVPLYEEMAFEPPKVEKGAQMRGVDDPESAEMRGDVVARLSGDELGPWEDIRQLGRKAGDWYRANLAGTTVVNKASGMKITFTRAGAKKLSARKGDVLFRAVPALRQILSDGIITSVSEETKGRNHIKAWHAISAAVEIDGQPRDVIAHVMETADGNFHYDLSRDMGDGARFMRTGAATSITASRYGLEDDPVDLNLDFAEPNIKGWAEVEADPPMTPSALRAVAAKLNAEVAASGLAGKVTVKVVRDLVSTVTGRMIEGRQTGATIEVRAGTQFGEIGVLRHEIIHVLRDAGLWGQPYGLFTAAEWHGLVRAARVNTALMARVLERKHDRPEAAQIEEAVAEMYRAWAAGRYTASTLARVFEKVRAFFEAMANALRGRGFMSADMAVERIATGKVGRRAIRRAMRRAGG